MSTVSGKQPSADPITERELAERALLARRMHHSQMLRRGLIAAALVAIVVVLSLVLYPVMVHLRTSWYLNASGLIVNWSIDEENWMSGGTSSVDHSNRNWYPRPVGPYLKYLPELLHLQSLNLSECEVSEQELPAVAVLSELKELNLLRLNQFRQGGSLLGMGDGCVASLRGLSRLETLSLSGNRITDKGLAMIAQQHPALEYLEIDATDVSDAGLASIQSLRKLKSVHLGGTLVTPEGIKKLQVACPGLEIDLHVDPEVERYLTEWRKRKP